MLSKKNIKDEIARIAATRRAPIVLGFKYKREPEVVKVAAEEVEKVATRRSRKRKGAKARVARAKYNSR